jgi:hypothetical protein
MLVEDVMQAAVITITPKTGRGARRPPLVRTAAIRF